MIPSCGAYSVLLLCDFHFPFRPTVARKPTERSCQATSKRRTTSAAAPLELQSNFFYLPKKKVDTLTHTHSLTHTFTPSHAHPLIPSPPTLSCAPLQVSLTHAASSALPEQPRSTAVRFDALVDWFLLGKFSARALSQRASLTRRDNFFA